MAVVYQAADLALGRTVAVKLMRFDPAGGAGSTRHSDEVAVLAHLNHFALVTLYDAGVEVIDGVSRSYIVTEFVDGTDLRSRLLAGPMDPAEVARLGADLCEALHCMGSLGITHRDIKPANVLLAPSDFPGRVTRAKLADFGIARLFNAAHRTETGAVVGTAGYLSPEQASGLPVGPTTDVYSLGLVLLECLTGEHSYPGTAVESALARLQRQPEIPEWLGPDWRRLLTGMTARRPEDRLRPAEAAGRLLALTPSAGRMPAADPAHEDLVPQETVQLSTVQEDLLPDLTVTRALEVPTTLHREVPPVLPVEPTEHHTAPSRRTAGRPEVKRPRKSRAANRSRRWPLLLSGLLVAVFTVGAVLFVVPGAEPPPEPPAYPAVGGQLGEHLKQLQESVDP
ncbi:serine/threonine protein kinase [Cryobacterium lactosi]|uniref:non-specific serine/threonine protein kinase n=2 Tax=Cryobacterium lactosi TaxID=1259202 RepID=A0A4R9BJH6_9MICO|nr:serine/threonine protein kinase [Cryobacterium lactosi]